MPSATAAASATVAAAAATAVAASTVLYILSDETQYKQVLCWLVVAQQQ